MALGVEPKEMNLMKRMPRNPNQGVLTKVTWLIILLQSMLIAVLTIAVYIISIYHFHYSVESAQSLVNVQLYPCNTCCTYFLHIIGFCNTNYVTIVTFIFIKIYITVYICDGIIWQSMHDLCFYCIF